ncbi:MAG: TetR/AcrR family transcriptional regulator [Rhodospirillales bacterium]|nr:TetR/AcrR family transcriptional regulator [Rhodospirillales bacterium]
MRVPQGMTDPLPRRQIYRLPRAQRVADIMLTARAVFREKGYNDAVIAEIAERAGVVEGTIYRYFAGKRDLLIKVVEHWYEEMLTDYDRQLEGIRGTWNRLRFMIWRHLTVIHDDPAMCRLIFNELRSGPEYRETAVFELNREYTNRTLAIVQDAMDSGEFRTGIPLRIVRDMIYGGVEHHIWAFLRGEGNFSPDESADAITDIIHRGLVRPGAVIDRGEQVIRRLEELAERLERASGQTQRLQNASGVATEISRTTGKASC